MLALQDFLNSRSDDDYRCVNVNIEGGPAFREDVGQVMRTIPSLLSVLHQPRSGYHL